MNPIMTMLKVSNAPQSNKLNSLIEQLKSGKLNAREKSLEQLKSLSPQQLQAVKQLLPKITQLGKIFGVSEENIQSFEKDIRSIG